jgi:hypothetical protein
MRREAVPARLAGAIVLFALACTGCTDDSGKPLGHGNVVVVDVDATTQPEQPEFDGSADSPFAPTDSPYGHPYDGSSTVAWCDQCACPAGTYCFGGGRGYPLFSGTCATGESTPTTVGCVTIPAACTATPTCACLLGAVGTSCYSACIDRSTPIVFCP